MKPISKSSWHYQVYFWTKHQWSKDYSFNHRPDLCSYIFTILLQAPITLVLWVVFGFASAIYWVIGAGMDKVMSCFKTPIRSTISCVVIFCLIDALFIALDVKQGKALPDAVFYNLEVLSGLLLGFLKLLVSCFAALALLALVYVLAKKAKSGGASFNQLVKTWATDGAGKRFCRTLTFVD